MKIHQLFKEKIPEELFTDIIRKFNIQNLQEITCFSKQDLVNIDIVSQMEQIKHSLWPYYLPCKAKIYLENLNINKCITILRQVLKLYQMKLESKQKYIKYKKTTVYYISRTNLNSNVIKVENHSALLEFE